MSVDAYALHLLCYQNEKPETCHDELVFLVTHEHLFIYAKALANKEALIPDWASYCKSTSNPDLCMSTFERDYATFKRFVLDAVNNSGYADKLKRCHKGVAIDSYIMTRKKQCIYQ
jgi:hypothetical protein